MGTTVIANQGDTIELICYRYFGYTIGVTEQTLENNPGLAAQGPVLAMGTKVELPDKPEQKKKTTINLWN